MTKPNVACLKCHGTGWEDKPGTSRRRPCPNCSKGQQPSAHTTGRPTEEGQEQRAWDAQTLANKEGFNEPLALKITEE